MTSSNRIIFRVPERGLHRSLVNYPHWDQWGVALMFSLVCTWTNGSANHRHIGDLRRHSVELWRHCNAVVMLLVVRTLQPQIRWLFQDMYNNGDADVVVMAMETIMAFLARCVENHQWIPLTKGQWCGSLIVPSLSPGISWLTKSLYADYLRCHGDYVTKLQPR